MRWTMGIPIKRQISSSLTSLWPTVSWSYLKVSPTDQATFCRIWHNKSHADTCTYANLCTTSTMQTETSQHHHLHTSTHILYMYLRTHTFYTCIFIGNTKQSVASHKCSKVGESIPHFFPGKDTPGNKQCPRGAVGWETWGYSARHRGMRRQYECIPEIPVKEHMVLWSYVEILECNQLWQNVTTIGNGHTDVWFHQWRTSVMATLQFNITCMWIYVQIVRFSFLVASLPHPIASVKTTAVNVLCALWHSL